MGVQYLGSDTDQLARLIASMKEARSGMPPCYLRSYSPTDKLCHQCDVSAKCQERTIVPNFPTDAEEIEECSAVMCDGDLHIELFNDRGDVIDRACSTPGCTNTLSKQRG